MTVPENCLIMYNCGLYHGQRDSARKYNWKDIKTSFQLINDSLFYDRHFEDNTTNNICKISYTNFVKDKSKKI